MQKHHSHSEKRHEITSNKKYFTCMLYIYSKNSVILDVYCVFFYISKNQMNFLERFYIGAVHKWCHPGGGGSAKRWHYSITLFSKMCDKGGEGSKISKHGWHHLLMAPYTSLSWLEFFWIRMLCKSAFAVLLKV